MDAIMEVVDGHLDSRLAGIMVQIRELKDEVTAGKLERQLLVEENKELKAHIKYLERQVDHNEQYSRQSCLILSGDDLPEATTSESGGPEDPAHTKKVVEDVIKNKLGVKLTGKILACHRLRKKDRAVVKFEDMMDRNKVYEARFQGNQAQHKVIIQENLTAKRAKQVYQLSLLKKKQLIGSYHTRNGSIFARANRDQRYVLIDPDWNEDSIVHAVHDAPAKQGANPEDHLGRSQTLSSIPHGHVASRRHDLEEFVVGKMRETGRAGAGNKK